MINYFYLALHVAACIALTLNSWISLGTYTKGAFLTIMLPGYVATISYLVPNAIWQFRNWEDAPECLKTAY